MTYRFTKLWVLLLCGMLSVAAFAQNANSGVNGTVEDASGAVVPGATIELTNVGTGQTLSTTSKGDGFYTLTNLSPANYRVTVTAQGFAQWEGVLTLRVSQTADVSPKLVAASVTTKVTVHDVTPVIDRVDSTISDVKNATTIETIPTANRSILNVLAFSPGVVAGYYGGSAQGTTRINGMQAGSLDYLVDGQTMSNRYTNELQVNPQPLPTFQEVKIITSNGDAQYSRPGIIELVTKSGTNHFHGQFFELNQNNIMKAKIFNQGPAVNYLNHNEFGGQIGGPIIHDHTFFFVDAEGIRENGNQPVQYIFPTTAMRGGDLSGEVDAQGLPIKAYDPQSTTVAGPAYTRTQWDYSGTPNVIPPNRLNPISQKILNTYLPQPNINGVAYWAGNANYIPTNSEETLRNKMFTGKLDQLFGPNRLAIRYTYTHRDTLTPGKYYILNPTVGISGGHNGAIVFTQVLGPRAINVVRLGLQYNRNFVSPQPQSPTITSVLGLPTYPGNNGAWPSFYWDGGSDGYWSGIDRNNPQDSPDQTITASDQFAYNRGNHQTLFGFAVDNYRINTFQTGQPGGSYNYSGDFSALQNPALAAKGTFDAAVPDTISGLSDFLTGETDAVQLNIYPTYHTRQTEYSGFGQDNWRVTQNLTLNLGLRYTYWTAFYDASGQQATFDPNVTGNSGCLPTQVFLPGQACGMMVYQGSGALPSMVSQAVFNSFKNAGLPIESAAQAGLPTSLWNMPVNNWQPRVGFAYQLDSKTVLRGGWGVYKWVLPLSVFVASTRKNPPFSYSVSYHPSQNAAGVVVDAAAAELEFPIAAPQYGGPQPLNQFMLGSPTLTLNTSNVAIQQGGGFNWAPMDPNYKPQTVQEYNLSLARELPGHWGTQISYIGNRSTHLLQLDPINFTIPREDCVAQGRPASCTAAQRRMYPVFATSSANAGSLYEYDGYANTNELQATVQHTFGGGLLVQSYFTWQRTLSTGGNGNELLGAPGQAYVGMMLPSALTNNAPQAQRLRDIYAPDGNLPMKTFSINGHYQFPFGRGQRFLGNAHGVVNALVSGYNISPFFLWHSGFYFAPYYTALNSGTILAPGKTGILPESQRKPTQWFDASIAREDQGKPYTGQTFIQVANTLDGDFHNNIPRDYMTGPGFNELDATVYKLTPITHGSVLDIEAQIFNVYNHQNLALPNNSGIITTTRAGTIPRTIQLQAKYIF